MTAHIRNPIEWTMDHIAATGRAIEEVGHRVGTRDAAPLEVRRITTRDIGEVLAAGVSDFAAYRTDVIMICLIYPLLGLILASWVFGQDLLPLLFPLASGFALIGPAAAVGLYEMSRRRERGMSVSWADAFGVVASPRFGSIVLLGLLLLALFAAWLFAAEAIYVATLGPEPPASVEAFISAVFTTSAGWLMIAIGVGVGFVFAVAALAIGVVSFPLLLDRDAGVPTAIVTSVRAVLENPKPMALWGLVVAGGLVVGSLPVLLGLAITVPVLGHATWHLYRRVVADTRTAGA